MKKFFSLFLSLMMVFLIMTVSVPVAFAAEYTGACGSNVSWAVDTFTGELTISGTGAMTNYNADSVPGWSAYQNYIKIVTVSDGVTSVGDYAFYNITGYKYQKLTTVNLSDTVEEIGSYAFRGCKSITTVIGTNVEQIGEYAFRGCSSLTCTDFDSLVEIGNGSFSFCSSLSEFAFSSTIKKIGPSAFKGCSGLKSLILPDNITSLGNNAFADCTGLDSVEFSASQITSYVRGVFNGAGIDEGMNITFGSNVTVVPPGLFENCSDIKTVALGSGVTTIGDYAFYSSGIKNITITSSVKSIGDYSFALCNDLVSFSVDSENTLYSSGSDGELMNKSKTYIYRYPSGKSVTSYTVPSTVRYIQDAAFYGDDDLITVDTANALVIYSYAFALCGSLKTINIPSVTSLGSYAFADCNSLSSVTAPKLSTVGTSAFFGCDSLSDLSGFTAVTTIGEYSFASIQGFETLTIPSTVTTIGKYAFCNCDNLSTLTVPSSVRTIRSGAFTDCKNLNKVTLSSGVKTIYEEAFLNCPALMSITIPSSVTSIGAYAFGFTGSGSSYQAVSGFKIYCYSSTEGYNYAYANKSNFAYEIVTDSVDDGVIIPDDDVSASEQEDDALTVAFSFIRAIFDFIKNILFG